MPITRSAIKKLRQDEKRTAINQTVQNRVRESLKRFKKQPTANHLSDLFRWIDTAAKKHIIHHKKADRIKSRLSKIVKTSKKTSEKPSGNK